MNDPGTLNRENQHSCILKNEKKEKKKIGQKKQGPIIYITTAHEFS
jgi:hypothetical protein